MADAAIADFDARITVFDSEFPDRWVRARGGRSRHVPGQCHALRILSRSAEVLSRERKASAPVTALSQQGESPCRGALASRNRT